MFQILDCKKYTYYNDGTYSRELEYAFYDFDENGATKYLDIDQLNNTCISSDNFSRYNINDIWKEITIETAESNIENYIEIIFSPPFVKNIFILKTDLEEILLIYRLRSQRIYTEKESIKSYVDNDILNIAENLLNIAEENIMLNYRLVAQCHINYSHIDSNIFMRNHTMADKYSFHYGFYKKIYGLKGKEKKNVENFNNELSNKFNAFSKLIDNFVEIIIEEKNVKDHIAKAVAWEAIQRKATDYYAQKWIEEYEINLTESFDDIYDRYINMDNSKIINAVKRNYIRSVLLCDEIDMEHSQEILMYYLLSKRDIKELILCDCFVEHYEMVKEIQQSIDSSDIKQKLRTKQKRKITKYSIDDIDLMSGTEFEEFVALLFKKMGYSSQVTKQSGDQGLDVIAIKNGTKIGIQAKCYSNTVGNAAIQEAVAGKNFYNCDKVLVITNNYFTTAAIELAQANNVILWNRDLLKEKIKELM